MAEDMERQVMLDYLGQALSVGDLVAYIHRTDTSAFFVRATVISFIGGKERRKVELRTISELHSKVVRVWPDIVVKINNSEESYVSS